LQYEPTRQALVVLIMHVYTGISQHVGRTKIWERSPWVGERSAPIAQPSHAAWPT